MKALKRITCLILAFVMCFGSAAAIYGDASSKVYIDDIKIGYGEAGKQALLAANYKVDSNFNVNKYGRGANDSDTSVWVGFHETDNALNAITDVAVMNMNGDYTFSGWADELEQIKKDVDDMLSDFMAGVEEFRANYKAGSPYAKKAYELMNYFVDTGFTNKLVGDLLRNEQTSLSDINNVFLKGNFQFITTIKKCIALACTEWKQDENGNYDTFVTRLNSNGYCTAEPDASMNHERELISTAISNLKPDIEDAEITRDKYYKSYSLVKDSYKLSAEELPENCSEEQIDTLQFENYIQSQCTNEQYISYVYYKNVIEIMKEITVSPEEKTLTGEISRERESLYDIVMKDSKDLKESDYETIRRAMTSGQIGVLDSIGFPALLLYESRIKSGTLLNEFDDILESIEDEYDIDKVSVYYGVDLSVFDDVENTALTMQAHTNLKNGEVSAFGKQVEEKTTGQKVGYVFACILTCAGILGFAIPGVLIWLSVESVLEGSTAATLSQTGFTYTFSLSPSGYAICGVVIVVCIALTVLAVITLLKSSKEKYVEQKDISYTKIPRCIVDVKTVKDAGVAEQKVYYTYTCAKRIDANESTGNTLDVYGDLNQYNKKDQWMCIYYTKNRDCGAPITSSVLLTESSNTPSGYVAIHDFGTGSASNLNRVNSGENKKAIYGYIKTTSFDSEIGQTASVFSRGATIIIAASSFIVGAGAAGAVTYSVAKKKSGKV